MKEFPQGGLLGKAAAIIQYLADFRIPVYASHVGYFLILSMFPTLVLLFGLLRYTGLSVDVLTNILSGFLPEALLPAAERLIISAYRNTTGTVVSLSALAALWSASRGIHGLLTGLNAIYHVSEDRNWFYTRTVSIAYTFAFLLVLLLTLLLNIFGTSLIALLRSSDSILLEFLTEALDLRFFLLLALQIALFSAMFTVLPNRRIHFRESLPGALLASLGWQIFSSLYSIYVEHFSGLSNIYGNVYGIALSMLWLYCCISIVFYGGVLNSYLAGYTAQK